jgi:hypothetical protein
MLNFETRNLIEWIRRVSWWYDHQQEGHLSSELIHVYNAEHFGESLAKSGGKRDPGKIDTIVAHVTGVRGGFGAMKKNVARLAQEYPKQFERLTAKQRAVAERFHFQTPYHTVGMRDCFVMHNRDYNLRTYHAGPHGNAFSSVCLMDCHPDEVLTVREVFTARKALAASFYKLKGFGNTGRRIRVITHAQVASKRRRGNDPGEFMYQNVIIPVCEYPEFKGQLYYDPYYSAGQGEDVTRWLPK